VSLEVVAELCGPPSNRRNWIPFISALTSVTLYSLERVLQTVSGEDGRFEFRNVPTGPLVLEATATGFQPKMIKSLRFTGNKRALLIVLCIGSVGSWVAAIRHPLFRIRIRNYRPAWPT
jgi:hypothetical protein